MSSYSFQQLVATALEISAVINCIVIWASNKQKEDIYWDNLSEPKSEKEDNKNKENNQSTVELTYL